MAVKKKKRSKQQLRTPSVGSREGDGAEGAGGRRLRRTDEEKIRLVQQVMASGNQSAELKKLGIYPNQFYDWKKKFAGQLGGSAAVAPKRGRGNPLQESRTAADEAKAFIQGKAALLDRLKAQRAEIDELIVQLEQ